MRCPRSPRSPRRCVRATRARRHRACAGWNCCGNWSRSRQRSSPCARRCWVSSPRGARWHSSAIRACSPTAGSSARPRGSSGTSCCPSRATATIFAPAFASCFPRPAMPRGSARSATTSGMPSGGCCASAARRTPTRCSSSLPSCWMRRWCCRIASAAWASSRSSRGCVRGCSSPGWSRPSSRSTRSCSAWWRVFATPCSATRSAITAGMSSCCWSSAPRWCSVRARRRRPSAPACACRSSSCGSRSTWSACGCCWKCSRCRRVPMRRRR